MAEQTSPLHVGAHSIAAEPPDVVLLRLVGDISREDVDRIIDAIGPAAASMEPRYFLLVDITRVGALPVESRRATGNRSMPKGYAGTACFGGSLQQRALVTLAWTAARLIWSKRVGRVSAPLAVKATEAEARAWLAEQRALPLPPDPPAAG